MDYLSAAEQNDLLRARMMAHGGGASRAPRRFDEYFRCYPIVMMRGPDRSDANHGGKIFLPPSSLDKLTRLHITYPMLFELINGAAGKETHAGVLEFTAEEGRVYMPHWLMETLGLAVGDMVQVKSTDLPLGTFIKLQPQSVDFLEISDPKAVLENAFRGFSCLTAGDIFTFAYNDNTYSVAVLETRPDSQKKAICTLETDLSVDFAPPVGYKEPERKPSVAAAAKGKSLQGQSGTIHSQGTMAQAINFAQIAPPSETNPASAGPTASLHFAGSGNKLTSKKGKSSAGTSASSTKPATPVAGTSANAPLQPLIPLKRSNGPQPLRLPEGKLFFGYEIKPVKKKEKGDEEGKVDKKAGFSFQGQGQSLRKKKDDK